MNFLQYKSDEMYSSTQLIRQSKMIFDKLSSEDIEKAVILRDGKPSFLLLDFKKYEAIMEEYLALKQQNTTKQKPAKEQNLQSSSVTEQKADTKEVLSKEEEIELQKALKDLDNLDMGNDVSLEKEELKEFWD